MAAAKRIEPSNFRLVTQCLNQLHLRLPSCFQSSVFLHYEVTCRKHLGLLTLLKYRHFLEHFLSNALNYVFCNRLFHKKTKKQKTKNNIADKIYAFQMCVLFLNQVGLITGFELNIKGTSLNLFFS
jgi:hypothetical protein